MNKIFEYKFQVLEKHLDTFGHVNNATYLELYEEARWDFITKNGYGLDKVQQNKVGPVILDIHLSFKKELKNRENVLVKSQTLDYINSLVMSLKQEMYKEGGELANTLVMHVGLFDLENRKLIKPTPKWLSAIGVAQ